MRQISRRQFSGIALASASALAMPSLAFGMSPRVVVVGGGAGGATAARYIAKDSRGKIDVTLVEATKRYYTCFFSNLYLGGFQNYNAIGHGYDRLASNHGVNVVHGWASGVDSRRKQLYLADGTAIPYDKLVLSPGIDMKYDTVPGYSIADESRMPHAWRSGTQIQILRDQVVNMKQGGTFVMVAPPNPYRCPPGPYERISMIAHIFKERNPSAKIIILDPKEKFSKQGLFSAGWEKHYPGMVEWLGPDAHGGIKNVDAKTMTIETDLDTFNADAACVIPGQRAGVIAFSAGVTDGDWCPIVPSGMQSKAHKDIHVLGDASVAAAMPKSGFSANSQAKVVANVVRAELTGSRQFEARFANTCWSLIATDDGVKVGANYKAGKDKIEVVDKFISQNGESDSLRRETYQESLGWYQGITTDMFS